MRGLRSPVLTGREVLKPPDITILAEIFTAREDDELGISSFDLAA